MKDSDYEVIKLIEATFIIWVVLTVAVVLLNTKFGLSIVSWHLIALIFRPLLELIFLLVSGSARKYLERKSNIDKDIIECGNFSASFAKVAFLSKTAS